MTMPGSTLPFEGLYWNHYGGAAYVGMYTGVTFDVTSYTFDWDDGCYQCYDFQFLDGCFADLREANAYYLTFSLLKSTEGLADGSN